MSLYENYEWLNPLITVAVCSVSVQWKPKCQLKSIQMEEILGTHVLSSYFNAQ